MITVVIRYKDKDDFSFLRKVKLPVVSVEETFIKKFQDAIQNGVKVIQINYDAPFEIASTTSLEDVNKLAKLLQDNAVYNLEDLYHLVFENASNNWIASAEGSGLFNVMPFDEEMVNVLLADKRPWDIIHSIDPDFNDTDDYLYFNGVKQLATMNDYGFNLMLKKSANMLLKEFCNQNDQNSLKAKVIFS